MRVNLEILDELVGQGYLSRQIHPTGKLLIYNYTEKCQYEPHWTPETMMCRGLIVTPEGDVVARPFPKFFNLEEYTSPHTPDLPEENFDVFDKYDGSLGIMYFLDGEVYLATRGSFTSTQATIGTQILREKLEYAGITSVIFHPGYTYLFEIVYPENRIVVSYGDSRDLIFLGAINIDDHTQEIEPEEYESVFTPAVRFVPDEGPEAFDYLKANPRDNAEGFVIRFKPSNMRVKIKYAEYVRLHRIITGVNARHIWDILRNNQSLEEVLTRVPDEFYKWVKETEEDLRDRFNKFKWHLGEVFKLEVSQLGGLEAAKADRKSFAERAKCYPEMAACLFKMYDGKESECDELIWKLLKPAAETPFKTEV